MQVDPTSGKITIDGIDISKIGLHDLRSRIVSARFLLWDSFTHVPL